MSDNAYPYPWVADGASIYDATGNRIVNCDPAVAVIIAKLYNEKPIAIVSDLVKPPVYGKKCEATQHIERDSLDPLPIKRIHKCVKDYPHPILHLCRCGHTWGADDFG